MFPGVAPGFFAARAEGPKNVGRTKPWRSPPASWPASDPGERTDQYKVSMFGREHSVTVERA